MVDYSVLIIDDDVWMQRILSKTLQSYGFNTTYLASNGFEGIDLAVEQKPSLIIMDILMPELSGHLTLKILKHIKSTKNIPVLMVSALSDTENLGLAVKSGTAGFISKPFTRSTVYEKLVSIFGKEKLDLIAKGEPIDNDIEFYNESNLIFKSSPSATEPVGSIAETENVPSRIGQQEIKRPINALYEDEHKKNIESIKKLLLKSKK